MGGGVHRVRIARRLVRSRIVHSRKPCAGKSLHQRVIGRYRIEVRAGPLCEESGRREGLLLPCSLVEMRSDHVDRRIRVVLRHIRMVVIWESESWDGVWCPYIGWILRRYPWLVGVCVGLRRIRFFGFRYLGAVDTARLFGLFHHSHVCWRAGSWLP